MKTKKLDKRTKTFKAKLATKGILITKKQYEAYKIAISTLKNEATFYTLKFLVNFCKKHLKKKEFSVCQTDKEICKHILKHQKEYKKVLKLFKENKKC
jgi:hypothetical protein